MILNIWQGEALTKLIEPERKNFLNSKCYDCENYNLCIYKKGLCFARAKMINDNYWSNDPLCPKDAAYYRFS